MKSKLAALGSLASEDATDDEEAPQSGPVEADEEADEDASADTTAMGEELAAAVKSGDGAAVYRAFEGMMAACQAAKE